MSKNVVIIPASGLTYFNNTASQTIGQILVDPITEEFLISGGTLNFEASTSVNVGSGYGDVYIGDGITPTNIIFEENGSIKGDGTAIELTLGSPTDYVKISSNGQFDLIGVASASTPSNILSYNPSTSRVTYSPYSSSSGSGSFLPLSGGTVSGATNFTSGLSANTFSATTATIRKITGGSGNTNSGTYSFIGGGTSNTSTGIRSLVGGGRLNTTSGNYSFIGGGLQNNINEQNSVIAGGTSNTTSSGYYGSGYNFIGGGQCNNLSSDYSTVSGGYKNGIQSGYNSFIGGGRCNSSSGLYATNVGTVIVGGENNILSVGTPHSSIVGGFSNAIQGISSSYVFYSFIGGGNTNLICGSSINSSTIGGGELNRIVNSSYSSILGGRENAVSGLSNTNYSTISGGYANSIRCSNSFIAAGGCNTTTGNFSFIGAGKSNTVSGFYSAAIGCGLNATAACTLYTNNIITGGFSATTISGTSYQGGVVTKISSGIDSSGNTTAGAFTIVSSIVIPANTFTTGDTLVFKMRMRKSGTNGTVNYRISANSTLNLTGSQTVGVFNAGATIVYGEISRTLAVKGATSEVFNTSITNTQNDVTTSTSAVSSLSIDWSVNQYIMFNINQSSSSDTTNISYYSITKI